MPKYVRALTALMFAATCFVVPSTAQQQQPPPKPATLPSETPATLQAVTAGFDYIRRDVMIPMRDA
jgi:hypothetical protein